MKKTNYFDWVKLAQTIIQFEKTHKIKHIFMNVKKHDKLNILIVYDGGRLCHIPEFLCMSEEPILITIEFENNRYITSMDCFIKNPKQLLDIEFKKAQELIRIESSNKKEEHTNMEKLPKIELVARETVDGKIEFLDFKNMLSYSDIKNLKYGDEIQRIYDACGIKMYKITNDSFSISHKTYSATIRFTTKTFFEKKEFNELVCVMKEIWDVFMDIRKKVHESKQEDKIFVVQI